MGFGVILGIAELTFGFASHGVIALGGGITFIALSCLGAIGYGAWRRNVALMAGPGWIGSSDFFGRRQYWPAAEINRILEVPLIYAKSSAAPRIRVIFLSTGDKRLITINPIAWGDGVLEKLYASAGRTPEVRARPVTANQLKTEMPGALMWSEKHVTLLGVLAAMVVLAMLLASYAVARALLGN
jgi:hypothetical protein